MALDKGRLEEIATAIALMYDPEVYSKLKTEINKPMADIPAGHALNINWDNIVNSYKVIKDFLKETLYKEDMSMENIGSKLVQRGTNGGIKVGDIYSSTSMIDTFKSGSGIAYKTTEGVIQYCNDYSKFFEVVNPNPTFVKNKISGYRVGSDGFTEQWLYLAEADITWHGKIINFPIPFKTDCLNIIVGRERVRRAIQNDSDGVGAIHRDKSSFVLQIDSWEKGVWVRAIGY
ncbi:MAG: hypothetical protein OGM09_01410 [Fusobacterium varium]|jgi:hypothetical protein|uniref:hypothetical protein n=1 Tax=Fusobacterium varium TaxID=856 RepID=UPI0022E6C240|nr:hypothetical protein [Fusobacterium varium]UYI78902.1 MAG: hypothetical protein OGM09_01410 [Fusobacterium varium]